MAVTEPVTNQPETEKYGITSNEEMRFKTKFYINLIEFEAWSVTIAIQELRKTIEWCLIHFGCPKMHLVSKISDSIRRMGSCDYCTTDISERLHIANVQEAY